MIPWLKLAAFVVVSIPIVIISYPSLRSLRFHGFYRFFAWEAIVILILLNIDLWFADPFSLHQIVSWLLLLISLFLLFHSVHLLRVIGKPDQQRDEAQLIGFEKTSRLVTVGAYRFIRHPLYGSLLFLAWGSFFKLPSWSGLLLAGLATLCLIATARIEEGENERFFGAEYSAYKRNTKMFIPFVF